MRHAIFIILCVFFQFTITFLKQHCNQADVSNNRIAKEQTNISIMELTWINIDYDL